MKEIKTYEDVMELFDRQIEIDKLKLATSFKRWADARDNTIEFFNKRTGIPKEHFERRLLDPMIEQLRGTGWMSRL